MPWPALPLDDWKPTYETLHMWTQIAGKVKVQLCPFLNEWWHVALHVTARGLTTSTIPSAAGVFEIGFDFIDHTVRISTSDGRSSSVALFPRSVADFYAELMAALRSLEIAVSINTIPDEVEDRTPFEQDEVHAAYDRDAVGRWWQIVVRVSRVLEAYRSGFSGKSSPVHFWWGGFDLNQTRFSGKPAAPPPGASRMMRLAEDQENVAAGFWPGGGKLSGPAFYSYIYPEPPGVRDAEIRPGPAYFARDLGEFVLPYDAVRSQAAPEDAILEFLRSTYEVQATLGGWDREKLEGTEP